MSEEFEEFWKPVLTVLAVIFGAIFLIAIPVGMALDRLACAQQAEFVNSEYRWGVFAGCYIVAKDVSNIRIIR